jgi:hypothetical protein
MKFFHLVAVSAVCGAMHASNIKHKLCKPDALDLKATKFIRHLYHAQGELYNPAFNLKIVEPPTADYLLDLLPEKVRDKVEKEMVGLSTEELVKRFSGDNAIYRVIYIIDNKYYDEDVSTKLEDMSLSERESSIRRGLENILTKTIDDLVFGDISKIMLIALKSFKGVLSLPIYERIEEKGVDADLKILEMMNLMGYFYPHMDHIELIGEAFEAIVPEANVDLDKELLDVPESFEEFVDRIFQVKGAQ